jgi:hypothetical protein
MQNMSSSGVIEKVVHVLDAVQQSLRDWYSTVTDMEDYA